MMPYVILLVAAGALGFGLCEYKPTKQKELLYLIIMTVVMCAMVICRGENVGIDYDFIYRDIFLSINNNNNLGYLLSPANSYRTEPLFVLVNMVCAAVSDSPMFCFAVFGVLIIVLRIVFIAKYSPKSWISLYFYISFGLFSYTMCTTRQELAISIAMFALPYIMDRKPIPYFVIIIAAGLMHNSLLMLLPLYWIVLIPPTKKWAIGLYSGGLLFLLLFSHDVIYWFTGIFKRFSYYHEGSGTFYLLGRPVITVIAFVAVMVVCCFFYKRIVEADSRNMILFNLYLFGTLVMIPVVKNFIFQRVAHMLLPFAIMLIAVIMASVDFRSSELAASDKKLPNNKRYELKKKADDDKRMYYSILALFMFIGALEYFMQMNTNRLDLVPYVTFWM